jgi:hypothetical protein
MSTSMRATATAGLAALVVCAVFLVYPTDAAPPEATMTKAGCVDAGPRTRDFLPQFAGDVRTIVNPCLGLSDLTGVIIGLIPDAQRNTVSYRPPTAAYVLAAGQRESATHRSYHGQRPVRK